MNFKTLTLESGIISKITLNRPESFNPINHALVNELQQALLEIPKKTCRVLVITGAGKAFCAGGDVKAFYEALQKPESSTVFYRQLVNQLHDVILILKELPFPVLMAVNGPAVGAGFSLAAAGDLIVASEKAYFSLGYLKIGLSPDGSSTYFLPRLLGPHKTMELMTFHDKIPAHEAKQLGFVARVFPEESFAASVQQLAQTLAELPTQAYAVAKKLVNQSFNNNLETQLYQETQGILKSAPTEDFKEGVTAFVEKRAAKFKG